MASSSYEEEQEKSQFWQFLLTNISIWVEEEKDDEKDREKQHQLANREQGPNDRNKSDSDNGTDPNKFAKQKDAEDLLASGAGNREKSSENEFVFKLYKDKSNTVQMPEAWAAQFTTKEMALVDSLDTLVGSRKGATAALKTLLETHAVDSPEGAARIAGFRMKLRTFDGKAISVTDLAKGNPAQQQAADYYAALSMAIVRAKKGPGEKVAVELTVDSARRLVDAILTALEQGAVVEARV